MHVCETITTEKVQLSTEAKRRGVTPKEHQEFCSKPGSRIPEPVTLASTPSSGTLSDHNLHNTCKVRFFICKVGMTVESKLFGELSKWVMLNTSHTLEGTQHVLASSAPFPWELDKAGSSPKPIHMT